MGLELHACLIHFSYRLAEVWCLSPGLPFAVNLSGFLHRQVGCEKCQLQSGATVWILDGSVDPASQETGQVAQGVRAGDLKV